MTTGRINQVAHRTRHRHCDAPCDHAHRGRKSKVNPASRPSTVREQHIKPNHNRQREGGTSPHTHSSTASESLGESPTTDQDRRLTLAAVRGTTRNDWACTPSTHGARGASRDKHKQLSVPSRSGSVHKQRDSWPTRPLSSA